MMHLKDNGTYPPERLDLNRMNRVMRHRLRNLCCGMKMALERVSDQTSATFPNVGDNCAVMISELENLLTFTKRMDLLFDALPSPESESLFRLIAKSRQRFAERCPFCTLKMSGPEITLKIASGSLVAIALDELLTNAGELSANEEVELKWECKKSLKFVVKNFADKIDAKLMTSPPQPFMTNRGRHDGLGLAIVQHVADAIGGNFSLKQAESGNVTASFLVPARHLDD